MKTTCWDFAENCIKPVHILGKVIFLTICNSFQFEHTTFHEAFWYLITLSHFKISSYRSWTFHSNYTSIVQFSLALYFIWISPSLSEMQLIFVHLSCRLWLHWSNLLVLSSFVVAAVNWWVSLVWEILSRRRQFSMVHAAYSFISVAKTCTNIVSLCGEKEHLFIPSGTKRKTFVFCYWVWS